MSNARCFMNTFELSFQQFAKDGDLLSLTLDHPEAQFTNVKLPWENCRASLLATGILLVEPIQKVPGLKNIVISVGIHGNETAPIEIANQITRDVAHGNLEVRHCILFVIGNPLAMVQGKRFIHENINRLFKVKDSSMAPSLTEETTQNNIEYNRASSLKAIVKTFFKPEDDVSLEENNNFHYDLHTAIRESVHEKFAIYPYKSDRSYSLDQLQFLLSSGINTVLFSHGPASTFSYHSSRLYGAHAFTIELGKVKKFGENDMKKFTKISHALRSLIAGIPIVTKPFFNDDFNLFEVCHEIIRTPDGFSFYMDDKVQNFESFPDNTLLWEDNETCYKTSGDTEGIVFPNPNVPIGQRVALVIKPTSIN